VEPRAEPEALIGPRSPPAGLGQQEAQRLRSISLFGDKEDRGGARRIGLFDRRPPPPVVELLHREVGPARSSGLVERGFVLGVVHCVRVYAGPNGRGARDSRWLCLRGPTLFVPSGVRLEIGARTAESSVCGENLAGVPSTIATRHFARQPLSAERWGSKLEASPSPTSQAGARPTISRPSASTRPQSTRSPRISRSCAA
jgi:hypothetical protein